MLCPQCFTSWDDGQDYLIHLEAHGIDPWKCQQLRKDLKILSNGGPHKPNETCSCRAWGARFECEMRVYKCL